MKSLGSELRKKENGRPTRATICSRNKKTVRASVNNSIVQNSCAGTEAWGAAGGVV